jgi:chaperonin GroEL
VIGKILEKEQYAFGFDTQTGEYANLVSYRMRRQSPAS